MTFYEILTQAVADILDHGFDSEQRVRDWEAKIAFAAAEEMIPEHVLQVHLRNVLTAQYKREVEQGRILKFHPGVSRFTLINLKPRLHAELQRRIMASAQLIKLNRAESIASTLRRFSGWASSVPIGGVEVAKRNEIKGRIKKSLGSLSYEERRVIIDQSHKFSASLNEIIATDGGAIAVKWHSHWRQMGYNYRKDHKERDEKIYLYRNSLARSAGFVKAGEAGYYDDITKVAEEVYCRCFAQYIYALRSLPDDMLTEKGRQEIKKYAISK